MRLLGIDFGSKRVGIALSDEGNTVAFPKAVIENGPGLVDEVVALCAEAGAGTVVLGESRDYKGEYNAIMEGAFAFKAALEGAGLAVVLEPEFMTSAQAGRQGETKLLDASAAAIILQSYLDKLNNKHDQHRRIP